MEETIISLLQERLNDIDANIIDIETEVEIMAKQPHYYSPVNDEKRAQQLTNLKQQKAETVSCIKWLKSI